MSDKTEEATPKRLQRARDEGDTPTSTFASQAIAFVVVVAIAKAALTALASKSDSELRAAIGRASESTLLVKFEPAELGSSLVTLTAPLLVAAGVASAVSSWVQSGGVVATKRLRVSIDRLNPLTGLASLVSWSRLFSVFRAVLFGSAVAYFAFAVLKDHAGDLARTTGRFREAVSLAALLAWDMAKRTAVFGAFLAVLDVVVTRASWRKKLRMSKTEVLRELKESGEDAVLKAARERAREEIRGSYDKSNLSCATVVVVDRVHAASAVRYEENESGAPPVVLASVQGGIAARFIAEAHAQGVPVVYDGELAHALAELGAGSAIPETMYEAVALAIREAWTASDG